jgi:hypothetical protein
MYNVPRLIEVVETEAFLRSVRDVLDEDGRAALIDYLARNPLVGDVVPNSGGVRKLRWAAKGKGKRGGARVIYVFFTEHKPLYLMYGYAKNAKADLSSEEKRQVRWLAECLSKE